MLTNEQRIAAMHEKAEVLRRERQRRRILSVQAASLAVCLAVVAALAAVIPGLTENAMLNSGQTGMAASIFSDNAFLGYIVVGVAAFLLGIAFTVFCVSLKKWKDGGGGKS